MEILLTLYLVGIVAGLILIAIGIKLNELTTWGDVAFAAFINIIPIFGFSAVLYATQLIIREAEFWDKPIKKARK